MMRNQKVGLTCILSNCGFYVTRVQSGRESTDTASSRKKLRKKRIYGRCRSGHESGYGLSAEKLRTGCWHGSGCELSRDPT
jgi:hypothetical protein